jgi:VWFA-related protein
MPTSAQFRSVFSLLCMLFVSLEFAPAQVSKTPDDSPFKIEVDVNRVLIPVVVRDSHGHTISDLKQSDFQVFADGKPVTTSAFSVSGTSSVNAASSNSASTKDRENTASATISPQAVAPAQRFVIFLFDDMHLKAEDLARSQQAGVKVLTASLAEKDIADVISLSGKTDSGLTRDRVRLKDTMLALRPNSLYRNDGGGCPSIDYYQADQIENKHNEIALQGAIQQVFNCSPGMDRQRDLDVAQRLAESAAMRALTLGQMDSQTTYAVLQNLVQRVASLPGDRILILVSPGFQSMNPEALTAESRVIQIAAQSNIVINTLDARGLYTTEATAQDPGAGSPALERLRAEYRRSTASENEGPMAALAAGTGGTFFRNSNDLAGGLSALTALPEYLYLLEISPEKNKVDGTYHRLKVKVSRNNVDVQARLGYFVPKPVKTKPKK